jgi:hypothetical protein
MLRTKTASIDAGSLFCVDCPAAMRSPPNTIVAAAAITTACLGVIAWLTGAIIAPTSLPRREQTLKFR